MSVRNANSQSVDGTTGKIADVPIAPTSAVGTDVGTAQAYNNGAVSVAFTPDATYWPATSFTAVSSPGGFTATGATSPLVVSGLNSQTAYTFTVSGTNSAYTSAASSASASVTATTVPQTPTIGTVTRVSDSSVSLPFTGNTGGKNLSAVTITSSPSLSLSYSGTTSPVAVSASYAYGTDYSFTMTSTNANGTSSTSSASNTVSPNLTVPPAYESIATSVVGAGGAASITFSSIPQTYKHLQIRAFLKADSTGRGSITINSGNFAIVHQLFSDGTGAGASPASTYNWPLNFSATANIFGSNVIDLLDYTSTSKTRLFKVTAGVDYNGSGSIFLMSSLDLSTTATNTITLTPATGNWSQYTHVALYGIKG